MHVRAGGNSSAKASGAVDRLEVSEDGGSCIDSSTGNACNSQAWVNDARMALMSTDTARGADQ